jgi:hypothetical protein
MKSGLEPSRRGHIASRSAAVDTMCSSCLRTNPAEVRPLSTRSSPEEDLFVQPHRMSARTGDGAICERHIHRLRSIQRAGNRIAVFRDVRWILHVADAA